MALLRYDPYNHAEDDLVRLPRSHFPTSTRSPAATSPGPSAFPPSSSLSTFDTSFPRPAPRQSTGIPLSLSELRQTFQIFASSRPRTRTGLHRLLIVVELISKQHQSSEGDDTGHSGFVDSGMSGTASQEGTLKGGGKGLNDREWSQLLSFVGTSMRKVRPDPEVRSVLDLFTQRQELLQQRAREQDSKVQGRRRGGKPTPAERATRQDETKLYNTLLHVAQKGRMSELFDQVVERMEERSVEGDAASFVAKLSREDDRNGSIGLVWNWLGKGIRHTMLEGGQSGKRSRKESRKVLWNRFVWSLAKRGMFSDVERVLSVMNTGETIELESLKPADPTSFSDFDERSTFSPYGSIRSSTVAHAPPPVVPSHSLQVRLPKPDARLYSSLIQAYCHHGQLKMALLTMYDMIHHASIDPTPQHFHHLFRAYVRFGQPERGGGGAGRSFDWVSLRGINLEKTRNRVKGRDTSSSSPLSVIASGSGKGLSSKSDTAETTEFTLSTLHTIFQSFLSISPPRQSQQSTLPFEGQRTAPSPQTVFFLLEAFDKLLGGSMSTAVGEPELLLDVYETVEAKFTNRDHGKARRTGAGGAAWTGWRMDRRVQRLVQGYRNSVAEKESRLQELA